MAHVLLLESAMMAFTHILVPTDFGEAAEEAIDAAVAMATKFDAKITLLHAFFLAYPLAYANGFYVPMEDVLREARNALSATLARTQERHPNSQAYLARGEPWRHILYAAEEREADLVIMGTHGRRGVSRLLLGSVAEKIVRLSPVPVLTVSPRRDRVKRKQTDEPDLQTNGKALFVPRIAGGTGTR